MSRLTLEEKKYWTNQIESQITTRIERHKSQNPRLTPIVTQETRLEAESRLGITGYEDTSEALRSKRDGLEVSRESAQEGVLNTFQVRISALEKERDRLTEELEALYLERKAAKTTLDEKFQKQFDIAEKRLGQHQQRAHETLVDTGMVESPRSNYHRSNRDFDDTIKRRINDLATNIQSELLEATTEGGYVLKLQRLRTQATNEIYLSSTITHIRGIWQFVASFLGVYSDEFAEKFNEEIGTRKSRVVTFDLADKSLEAEEGV
jgi:hypothetical protein